MLDFLKRLRNEREMEHPHTSEPGPPDLTPPANAAMKLARQAAQRWNRRTPEPKHVLLGVVMLGRGGACQVLRNMGVEPDTVCQAVEATFRPKNTRTSSPPGPGIHKLFGLARQEANMMRHTGVGTEHLLLALLRDDSLAELLQQLGIHLARTRREIVRLGSNVPPLAASGDSTTEAGPYIDV